MKKVALVVSLVLNLALVGALIYRFHAESKLMPYQKIFSQDEVEATLFGSPISPERDGEQRIGIKCLGGIKAELTAYEARGGRYETLFRCPAVIGMNGPCTQCVGDCRTPLGTWTIGNAYGINEDPGSFIPYEQIDDDMYWRGAGGDATFNTLVRKSDAPDLDYSDDEHLIEYTVPYRYLIDMGFNSACAPYVGSALFLHVWQGENHGTHGCVGVAEENMVKILQTIKPGATITIY